MITRGALRRYRPKVAIFMRRMTYSTSTAMRQGRESRVRIDGRAEAERRARDRAVRPACRSAGSTRRIAAPAHRDVERLGDDRGTSARRSSPCSPASASRLRAQCASGSPAATRMRAVRLVDEADRGARAGRPVRRPRSSRAGRPCPSPASCSPMSVGASAVGPLSGSAARTCPRSGWTARRPSRPAACRGSSGRRGPPSTGAARRRGSPSRR